MQNSFKTCTKEIERDNMDLIPPIGFCEHVNKPMSYADNLFSDYVTISFSISLLQGVSERKMHLVGLLRRRMDLPSGFYLYRT